MGLVCGIVGLPNAGKSTLFNALTAGAAAAENYPFCTIEPNAGIAELADARLDKIAELANAARTIYAPAEFVDIAGLVRGASQNAGLGNRFLAHIREADGIAHVVRCFDEPHIAHVEGEGTPADDIATVNTELALADLATAEKAFAKAQKQSRTGEAEARRQAAACEKCIAHLSAEGKALRTLVLDEREKESLRELHFLTMKPALYVANTSESGIRGNAKTEEAKRAAEAEGAETVIICARAEAEMAEWNPEERAELLRDMGAKESGLARLARAAFAMMGLTTFFTAGKKEARAWTIKKGATAREAAGVIHGDFARAFIRAEVCSCEDYLQCGGEAKAKAAGKIRAEGAEYTVQEADIIHFRTSA